MNRNHRLSAFVLLTVILASATGCVPSWRKEAARLEKFRASFAAFKVAAMALANEQKLPLEAVLLYNKSLSPAVDVTLHSYAAVVETLRVFDASGQAMTGAQQQQLKAQVNQLVVQLSGLAYEIGQLIMKASPEARTALEKDFEPIRQIITELEHEHSHGF